MIRNISDHEWRKLKEKFDDQGYFNYEDYLEDKRHPMLNLKGIVEHVDHPSETWKCPLNKLPPEILSLLFDLHFRLLEAEEKIKELERK